MARRGQVIGKGIVPYRKGPVTVFVDDDSTKHLFILDRHNESGYVPREHVTFIRPKALKENN